MSKQDEEIPYNKAKVKHRDSLAFPIKRTQLWLFGQDWLGAVNTTFWQPQLVREWLVLEG